MKTNENSGWATQLARGAVLLAAALMLLSQVSFILVVSHNLQYAVIGFDSSNWTDGNTQVVHRILRGSSGDRAGIKPGDHVRWDDPSQSYSEHLPGGQIPLTVEHGGVKKRVMLQLAPTVWAPQMVTQIFDFGIAALNILAIILGVLITLRRQLHATVLWLSAAVIFNTAYGLPIPYWLCAPALAGTAYLVYYAAQLLAPVAILGFSFAYRLEITGRSGHATTAIFAVFAGSQFIFLCLDAMATVYRSNVFFLGDAGETTVAAATALGTALTIGIFAIGRREAAASQKDRFGIMIPSLLLYYSQPLFGYLAHTSPMGFSPFNPLLWACLIAPLLGLVGMTYALLTHRVVDLGFAINRTLTFGVLSFAILLTFWFAEWGIEHLLPREAVEANAVVSAATALGLFLVFERAREWAKHLVEAVFFRSWRENEERLNRFVREAAFITKESALCSAAICEFERFTGGAAVGLFWSDGEDFKLRVGSDFGSGTCISADAPTLVRLRHDRTLEEQPLPGVELLLPIMLRASISGFFLVAAKRSGELYRPDERDALANAAQRVGQDIAAMEIDRYELLTAQLRTNNDQLRLALTLVGKQSRSVSDSVAPASAA